MSSLGDLLLGKIGDGSEREHEDKQNQSGKHYQHREDADQKETEILTSIDEKLDIPLPEEKNKIEQADERSNASSTDDYVRELLDPNDRPRNVWHVVEGPKDEPLDSERQSDQVNDSLSPSNNGCNNIESTVNEASHNLPPKQRISTEFKETTNEYQKSLDETQEQNQNNLDEVERYQEPPNDRSRFRQSDREDNHERSGGSRRDRKYDRDHRREKRSSSDRHKSRKRHDYSDDDDEDLGRNRHSKRRRNSRSRSRSPSSRTSSKRRERSKSDSRSPLTNNRNSRTVLVMQLSPRVMSRDLEDFFRKVGRVREVRLIMDSKTRRHKGIAYIEFDDAATASKAMVMNGQKFMGAPMVIQSALSEKSGKSDRYHSTTSQYSNPYQHHSSSHSSSRPQLPSSSYRVYVGSLHVALTEEMIRSVFEPFGPIIKVELMKDRNTGISRGYCFLTYANVEDGQEAVRCLDGFELAGKNLRVSKSADKNDH